MIEALFHNYGTTDLALMLQSQLEAIEMPEKRQRSVLLRRLTIGWVMLAAIDVGIFAGYLFFVDIHGDSWSIHWLRLLSNIFIILIYAYWILIPAHLLVTILWTRIAALTGVRRTWQIGIWLAVTIESAVFGSFAWFFVSDLRPG